MSKIPPNKTITSIVCNDDYGQTGNFSIEVLLKRKCCNLNEISQMDEVQTEYCKFGFLELIKLDSDKICIDLIIER